MSIMSIFNQITLRLPTYLPTLPLKPLCQPLCISVLCAGAMTAVSLPAYACQLPQSYYKHVSCTSNDSYFLAVKDSGAPVALLNTNGEKVADLMRYSQVDATKLRNGVMPVQVSGKLGYVNTRGREVVPAVYDSLANDPNTNGWARQSYNNRIVVKKAGQFGVISTSNQIIVPFSSQYQNIHDFKNGKAQVVKRSGTSWIGTNGRALPNSNPSASTSASSRPSSKDNQSNQSNASGTNSDANSIEVTSTPSAPLARRNEIWMLKKRDGKWGYINSEGVPMIRFAFDEAKPFSEGFAGVRISNNWGFIDLSGELVIPFRFSADGIILKSDSADVINNNESNVPSDTYLGKPPFVFTGGKAWIGSLTNGTKLCIDKLGTNITCDEPIEPLEPIEPIVAPNNAEKSAPNLLSTQVQYKVEQPVEGLVAPSTVKPVQINDIDTSATPSNSKPTGITDISSKPIQEREIVEKLPTEGTLHLNH